MKCIRLTLPRMQTCPWRTKKWALQADAVAEAAVAIVGDEFFMPLPAGGWARFRNGVL